MIKGGVWKNTEDEILKAAVMKYGKNQWSRISSLLVRKSAKQCKARWYEWLDPSIRKTEWTRDEDEKLLHLAKLMPTQWRTIAPIVGRTPAQCLERYEKLLDAACAKDENYEGGEDPRRLRPGEIDPNPESKPARPDPVDMDEDEKEMLSEARARLANTKGKKAKRKAREKQLEEARRLATLQKRRELKAAGLDNQRRMRKRRGIDYSAEIPFEHKPATGFFDTSKDAYTKPSDEEFLGARGVAKEDMEGTRRADIEEALRKHDMKTGQVNERHNLPDHVQHVNEMNDPDTYRKRSKLMLPAPQISERELEELAKMGAAGTLENAEMDASGATGTLLNEYATPRGPGATPMRTPMRTPKSQGDAILQEAENLYKLTRTETPLLGGENPELHPSDFTGVTPKRKVVETPNTLMTPRATPGGSTLGGETPRLGSHAVPPSPSVASIAGSTPLRTPIRDGLNINDPDSLMVGSSAREEKAKNKALKSELMSGLADLPAPKNEYQIEVPDAVEAEEEEEEEPMEEDAIDLAARRQKAAEEAAALEFRKKSKALQRELPRPISVEGVVDPARNRGKGRDAEASRMIDAEMGALLTHDAAKYPVNVKKDKKPKLVPEIEDFDEDALAAASLLIKEEAEVVRRELGHAGTTKDEYDAVWLTCFNDILWLPEHKAYGRAKNATNSQCLASVQGDFERSKGEMDKDAKRAAKLEQKVMVLTAGYSKKAEELNKQIQSLWQDNDQARTQLQCFKTFAQQEDQAAATRLAELQKELEVQREREKTLQLRYETLLAEHEEKVKITAAAAV